MCRRNLRLRVDGRRIQADGRSRREERLTEEKKEGDAGDFLTGRQRSPEPVLKAWLGFRSAECTDALQQARFVFYREAHHFESETEPGLPCARCRSGFGFFLTSIEGNLTNRRYGVEKDADKEQ